MTATATAPSDDTKVRIVCPQCGSSDVIKDAAAAWDEDAQEWSLLSTYDSTTCQNCEYESDWAFQRVPITSTGE